MINCYNKCPDYRARVYSKHIARPISGREKCLKCVCRQLRESEARIASMAATLRNLDYCPRKFGFTDKTSTGNCPIQKVHDPYPGECEQCWDYSLEGGYDDKV